MIARAALLIVAALIFGAPLTLLAVVLVWTWHYCKGRWT